MSRRISISKTDVNTFPVRIKITCGQIFIICSVQKQKKKTIMQ